MKVIKDKDIKKVIHSIKAAQDALDKTYDNGAVSARSASMAQISLALAEMELRSLLDAPAVTYGKKYKSKKKN